MDAAAPAEISAPPIPKGNIKPEIKPISANDTAVIADEPKVDTKPIAIARGAPSFFAERRVARLIKMKSAPMPKILISDNESVSKNKVTRVEHWKNIRSYFWLSVLPSRVKSISPENMDKMEMLSEKSPENTKVRMGVISIIVSEHSMVAKLMPETIHS